MVPGVNGIALIGTVNDMVSKSFLSVKIGQFVFKITFLQYSSNYISLTKCLSTGSDWLYPDRHALQPQLQTFIF